MIAFHRCWGKLTLSLVGCLFHSCTYFKSLRADVDTLARGVDTLRIEVRELNVRTANLMELVRLSRADQQVRLDELEKTLESMGGAIVENQAKLSKIDEKTQALKQGWEERARADSLAKAAEQAETQSLFDVAISDFNAGRRAVALAGFEDIVRRFPDSQKAEEALYWIGECHYAQKMKVEAEKTYLQYLKLYPAGMKVCPALFKLGQIYHAAKRNDERNAAWNKLIETCPNSEESEIAKSRMKK